MLWSLREALCLVSAFASASLDQPLLAPGEGFTGVRAGDRWPSHFDRLGGDEDLISAFYQVANADRDAIDREVATLSTREVQAVAREWRQHNAEADLLAAYRRLDRDDRSREAQRLRKAARPILDRQFTDAAPTELGAGQRDHDAEVLASAAALAPADHRRRAARLRVEAFAIQDSRGEQAARWRIALDQDHALHTGATSTDSGRDRRAPATAAHRRGTDAQAAFEAACAEARDSGRTQREIDAAVLAQAATLSPRDHSREAAVLRDAADRIRDQRAPLVDSLREPTGGGRESVLVDPQRVRAATGGVSAPHLPPADPAVTDPWRAPTAVPYQPAVRTHEGGPAAELAGVVPARFLRSGDRFRWQGEDLTVDDDPIRHDGVVTVALDVQGDSEWVELPTDAPVVVNPEPVLSPPTTNADNATVDDIGLDRVRARLARLPTGPITNEALASVGVTGEEFDRLIDADMDTEAQEYHQQRRELIAGVAESMALHEAQTVLTEATALRNHTAGCNLAVEHCATCTGQERDSAATFWDVEVPAAQQRIARDATTGHDSLGEWYSGIPGLTVDAVVASREHTPTPQPEQEPVAECVDREPTSDSAVTAPGRAPTAIPDRPEQPTLAAGRDSTEITVEARQEPGDIVEWYEPVGSAAPGAAEERDPWSPTDSALRSTDTVIADIDAVLADYDADYQQRVRVVCWHANDVAADTASDTAQDVSGCRER